MVIKHAAEVAQVVEAAKQQAPLFAQQAQQTIHAEAQAPASPSPNSNLSLAEHAQQQPRPNNVAAVHMVDSNKVNVTLDSNAAAAPQLSGSSPNLMSDSSGAAAEQNSHIEAHHAQQAGSAVTSSSLTGQAQHAQQLRAQAEAPSVQLPAIQRRVVKPITMARGSSAFNQNRPAPAVPAAPSASLASGLATGKTVSTHQDSPQQQQQQQQQSTATTSNLLSSTVSAPVVSEASLASPAASTAAPVAQADKGQAGSAADRRDQPGSSTSLSQGSQQGAVALAASGLASALGNGMTQPVKLQPQIKLAGSSLFGKSAGASAAALPQPNQASQADHVIMHASDTMLHLGVVLSTLHMLCLYTSDVPGESTTVCAL